MKAAAGALALSCLVAATSHAAEADFVIVTGMPPVQGEARSSFTAADARTGLTFAKTVYASEVPELSILTHVAMARCGGGAADADDAFIMAIQYLPKNPQTFTAATQTDVFKEVYVRDGEGAVRLYENLNGREMAELTDRFLPGCQGI